MSVEMIDLYRPFLEVEFTSKYKWETFYCNQCKKYIKFPFILGDEFFHKQAEVYQFRRMYALPAGSEGRTRWVYKQMDNGLVCDGLICPHCYTGMHLVGRVSIFTPILLNGEFKFENGTKVKLKKAFTKGELL